MENNQYEYITIFNDDDWSLLEVVPSTPNNNIKNKNENNELHQGNLLQKITQNKNNRICYNSNKVKILKNF